MENFTKRKINFENLMSCGVPLDIKVVAIYLSRYFLNDFYFFYVLINRLRGRDTFFLAVLFSFELLLFYFADFLVSRLIDIRNFDITYSSVKTIHLCIKSREALNKIM